MMERRSFLRLLGLGAAAAVAAPVLAEFDPERLLWIPGEKTFFLPSPPVLDQMTWMNTIALEYLRLYRNNLILMRHFDRSYSDLYTQGGVGYTVKIHLPSGYR